MKRALLTGAGGYVGRHVVDALVARGFEVHGVSRRALEPRHGLTWHTLDLLDDEVSESLCERVGASHLVHLAWETEPGRFWESEKNSLWCSASRRLLESFVRYGGRRAVLTGTCAEYDWTDGHCVAGVTRLRARSTYSRAKLAFRESAFELSEATSLGIAWARVFLSFGPFEDPRRVVPASILALLANERFRCTDGEQLRDFMHVTEVADAMASLADSTFEGDVNVAHGTPTTIRELVERIADRLDARQRVDFGAIPRPPNDPPRITADVSGLESLPWTPRRTLDAAIDETIAWWRGEVARTDRKRSLE